LLAADDDVTEHGKCDGQPHGSGVCGNRKVDVKQQVDDPARRVPVARIRYRDTVEVDGVRQVRQHRQQVGNRQCSQQVIRGRYLCTVVT